MRLGRARELIGEKSGSPRGSNRLPEQNQSSGRSPFAVPPHSPFAQRRAASPQHLSPTYTRKFSTPRLCRGFSDPGVRRRPAAPMFMFGSLSPDRHDTGSDLLTLPPIPEGASSSSDYKDECE
ncbi:unnamed protein product [Strongylus vulgaris]|uniref:Uncharacterized protein n=1 Tax=Strongylus vulgaris TaxID=40348 RepID=A0A3P7JYC3_STRVU|nr:unnamed protein product [Strongylus vulgaris]